MVLFGTLKGPLILPPFLPFQVLYAPKDPEGAGTSDPEEGSEDYKERGGAPPAFQGLQGLHITTNTRPLGA
jgi:hypothetical protein